MNTCSGLQGTGTHGCLLGFPRLLNPPWSCVKCQGELQPPLPLCLDGSHSWGRPLATRAEQGGLEEPLAIAATENCWVVGSPTGRSSVSGVHHFQLCLQ